MLTARIVDAAEALRLGLVHRVVEPDDLMSAAIAHANLIAGNAPLAVRMTKRAAYRSYDTDMPTSLEFAATYQGMVQNTEDHQEAVAAILEKRSPQFHGR